MNDFMEKWRNDPRFKAKIKLLLYTLFVVFAVIFALSNTTDMSSTIDEQNNITNNNTSESKKNDIIEIPTEYNYIINININGDNHQYTGIKNIEQESITKKSNEVNKKYIYKNDDYYKEETGNYIVTTKEEVYDIVNYNYLQLETINQYLTKSTKKDDQYIVYLKDIILGNDSNDYITISVNEDDINNKKKIKVDYTSLMKLFDNKIENYLIEFEIEETE